MTKIKYALHDTVSGRRARESVTAKITTGAGVVLNTLGTGTALIMWAVIFISLLQ